MYEAGRSGFRSLRTCWEFGWKPKFTELGDREDGLGEKETLPKMKGAVQARRYVGDLAPGSPRKRRPRDPQSPHGAGDHGDLKKAVNAVFGT